MKIAVSFLSSNYEFKKTIDLINKTDVSYLHVDVMDGLFVNNKTPFNKKMLDCLKDSPKPKEIHFMTLHLKKFIDIFSYIQPEIVYYSYEATTDHNALINYIKEKKCQVGIAVNPLTDLSKLSPYLNKIDAVLLMSVIPGYGGQEFIKDTPFRIKQLMALRKEHKAKFIINVDGGVNDNSWQSFKKLNVDRIVVGSYVCKSADFDASLAKLK